MSLYKMAENEQLKEVFDLKYFWEVSLFKNYITNIMMEVTLLSCILYYNTIVLTFKINITLFIHIHVYSYNTILCYKMTTTNN